MADIKKNQLERAKEIEKEVQWDCGVHEENSMSGQEHLEECLSAMLNAYIEDDRNYIVDGATICCDQMSDKEVYIRFKSDGTTLYGEGGSVDADYIDTTKKMGGEYIIYPQIEKKNIRKLYAVQGSSQSANGLRFATVADRTCLREKKEKTGAVAEAAENGKGASIVGCGNCKIFREADVEKIVDNWDKVMEYGTCYLLIKPDREWINPHCMESVTGTHGIVCTIGTHHKTMKFSTKDGEKEGLTMMSTLLCTRGGIITFKLSGQKIYVEMEDEEIEEEIEEEDIEYRIQCLVDSITGEAVYSTEELVNLSSVEILARVIYQEQSYMGERAGQNAVMFSILNRFFKSDVLRSIRNHNHIYSVITATGQYESIMNDDQHYPNAFQPPLNDSEEWENAKRLAAILYITVEKYGHNIYDTEANITGGTKWDRETEKMTIKLDDRDESVIDIDDLETREAMIDFIENQCDIDGNKIINEIDTRGNIVTNHTSTPNHSGGKIIGGNEFY